MKKYIKFLIFLIIVSAMIYLINKALIKDFHYSYKINNYKVEEFFSSNNHHNYDFVITKNSNTFIFSYKKNLNKKKKIVKSIKTYKSNNLICIIPKLEDNYKYLYCNLDNKQISIDYLVKSNNSDFQTIIEKSKFKYNSKSTDNNPIKYKKISIYNNLREDEKYIIWNYKGIVIVSKDKNHYQKILDYDLYDNIMSTIVGDYFVLFENTKVSGIENIYYYNLKKEKLMKYKLKEKLSKDSYINGVINNQIIVTDRKNKKQYQIDVTKNRIEEIDNNQTSYITYTDNIRKELSISDFFMEDQLFVITNNNYKYYYEDNSFYKVLNKKIKRPILLAEINDCDKWFLIDDEIYMIKEDQLLSYSDESGLIKIIEYNELKYNNNNIIKVWKE